MKSAALTFLLSFFSALALAQAQSDTTVYNLADYMPYPLVQACAADKHPGWNADSVRTCSETQFFRLLARSIRYPEEARANNMQGVVAVSCIVEPETGRITHLKVLKDIGGGCGEEAVRVLKTLDEIGLRWQPGLLAGKPVRVRHTLPIRFRLQEALPYYVTTEGDTVYHVLDQAPEFAGGMDSLISFVFNRLEYPQGLEKTCKTGIIEMAVLILPNKGVKVVNQLDFNNLGLDYQFEALRLVRRTAGMWAPAKYGMTEVASSLPLRVVFKSDEPGCAKANEDFDNTMLLADEGATLLEEEKTEEAIQKWSQALALQPDNCEILYYRGTAYMNLNRREEACKDYNRIKQLLGITWFEDVRRLVCGY
jgi:hypothetical protein